MAYAVECGYGHKIIDEDMFAVSVRNRLKVR
jgi:hypothetical protein